MALASGLQPRTKLVPLRCRLVVWVLLELVDDPTAASVGSLLRVLEHTGLIGILVICSITG